MSRSSELDPQAALRVLTAHNVDFIVVGGVCAVLLGAPINTFDLDVVHARSPANIDRLLAALDELEAQYRWHNLAPLRSHLESPGHQLLDTKFGRLDVLGRIGEGNDYDGLLPHTVVVEVDAGVSVRILDLETLIRTKTEAGGEKDLAVLPILRRLLAERR